MGNRPLREKTRLRFAAPLLALTAVLLLPTLPWAQNLRESAVVRAVRKASPAVVNISLEYEVRKHFNPFSDFENPLFEEFFKDFFEPGFERRTRRTSLGSGVIIDGRRGFVLTNAHVVEKTGTVSVVLNDEREFTAQIVGADPDSDLAILRIEAPDALPALEMGDSSDLMIGETVIAIGNPFGFSNTVTTGVISATNRSFRSKNRVYRDFIQTDASINPGNSGGPLLNIEGDLIGINTAIYAGGQGIGFAIPIDKARRIIADLIAYGEVVSPWVGVSVQDLDPQLQEYFGLTEDRGVMIRGIEPGSPAAGADLREGDVVVAVDGKAVESVQDYLARLREASVGDTITLRVWRKGAEKTVAVRSRAFPMERAADLAYDLLGVRVAEVGSGPANRFRPAATSGVVIVDLRPDSFLGKTGVRPGDVIRQINDRSVANRSDFDKAVVRFRNQRSLVVLLQRDRQRFYITVEI